MVSLGLLVGFVTVSALLSAVPGPSILLSTGRAVVHGRRAGMLVVAGNWCGGLLVLAAVVAGLGAVVAASAALFTAVKIAGAVYLLWLGISTIREVLQESRVGAAVVPGTGPAGAPRARDLFRSGVLVGSTNPKSVVALSAFLPQFVDPARGHVALQMIVIGLVGSLAQVVIEAAWVVAAARLRQWFGARPRRLLRLRAAGGVAMIGLAGRLAVERPA